MNVRYDKHHERWRIPVKCWTTTPARGYSFVSFLTRAQAAKALERYKKLGRCLTLEDVEDL